MANEYPRVTIISSNPLRNDQTNGIMMSSLFRGWPKERLHQIYFRYIIDHQPDTDVCEDFSVIDFDGQIRPAGPRFPFWSEVNGREREGRFRDLFRFAARSQSLVNWARCAQEFWQVHSGLADRLRKRVQESRPDVVYSLVGNYTIARLVTDVCRELSLPLVMHVTDDFAVGAYERAPLKLLRHATVRAFGDMIAQANGRAACSPRMAEEYTRRYGTDWSWFTTLVDASAYDPTPEIVPGRLHCVYAGNLCLGRWKSLLTLSHALERLRRCDGIDAQLDIYSSRDQMSKNLRSVCFPTVAKIKGWAPPEALPEIFHKADVVVHAESSEPDMVEYVRYSLSAKVSQYMMSGRCILAVGPTSVGSISLVADLCAGLSIDEGELTTADAGLRQLCEPEWRIAAGRNGRSWALDWLERGSGHTRFRDALVTAQQTSNPLLRATAVSPNETPFETRRSAAA